MFLLLCVCVCARLVTSAYVRTSKQLYHHRSTTDVGNNHDEFFLNLQNNFSKNSKLISIIEKIIR